jgi:hypothetical protein
MEHFAQAGDSPGAPHGAGTATTEAGALRCGICSRRLGSSVYFVEETGDVPEPRGSWVLCRACNDAVHEQLEASPVRSPLRLRIAVGLVATDRTPAARRARFGELSDRSWMKLFFWLFLITMLVHLAVIVAIAGIIK